MIFLSLSNLLAIALQAAVIAGVAAVVASVLRITAPGVRYGFWRLVLLVCLVLPWLQTPQRGAASIASATPGAGVGPTSFQTAAEGSPLGSAIDWLFVVGVIVGLGIAGRLLWMAVGWVRLRRLRAAGVPLPEREHAALQRAIGTHAHIRLVPTVRQPVTFGVLHPVVLLPSSLAGHSAAIRHAVLVHELVHVRRRDWCWVIAEELVRTAFWFHPALWWLISRVQLAREEVVDATAVTLTGQRRAYLEAMLLFADEVPLARAPAFARRRHLFQRIVLLSTEDVMSPRRIVVSVVVMVLMVAAAGWTAARALPLEIRGGALTLQSGVGALERAARLATPENPVPSRVHEEVPMFPVEAQGENVAATVTLRTIVDHSGFVAELRLQGFEFRADGFSAALTGGPDAVQQFEQLMQKAAFRSGRSDAYIRAEGMRPLLQAFIDAASAAVQHWRFDSPKEAPIAFDSVVQFTPGQPVSTRVRRPGAANAVTGASDSQMTDGALRIGGAVKTPAKIRDVKPVYPQEARDAQVQGVVIIEVRIEGDGTVSAARMLRSIPLLDDAALAAVRQWQFTPTLLNGVAVPVIMTVTVQFTLR